MIDKIKIIGGNKLSGEITVQGAKNEALQVICAALLTEEKVTLKNVPDILDVSRLIETMQILGVVVTKESPSVYTFDSSKINEDKLYDADYKVGLSNTRGALMITGALLGRFGVSIMARPGGDKIGIRPIDVHLDAFEKIGAQIDESNGEYRKIILKELKDSDFYLPEISVTGTANIILASVISSSTKKIIIRNAASEPYVVGLCNMLNSMGAQISGVGTNTLEITTVPKLSGTTHTLMPDFIEAGSLIGLSVLTESSIFLKGVSMKDLGFMIPLTFETFGIQIEEKDGGILIPEQKQYKIKNLRDGHIREIYDAPWPGLTPDLLSIFVVVAIQAEGVIKIHQKMFEKRLFFVDKLQEMGARIEICDPHRVIVIGLNKEYKLRGIKMSSPDIRAGMALLIAALSAQGESIIENASQISRGYENIFERLKSLGANIEVMQ